MSKKDREKPRYGLITCKCGHEMSVKYSVKDADDFVGLHMTAKWMCKKCDGWIIVDCKDLYSIIGVPSIKTKW